MYYAVTHLTLYKYSEPVTDSVMEIRKQPRNDSFQHCVRFDLDVTPDVKIISHQDYLGNTIHTFNIAGPHKQLAIRTETVVEVRERPLLPDALPERAWDAIDEKSLERDFFDMLMPGRYTDQTPLLHQFAQEIDWRRRDDPLSLVRELNTRIYERFDYQQHFTRFDSSIDIALEARRGVCQDFAHIMLALLRNIGIPCHYISGYLFHRESNGDRSNVAASHAWVEAWFPELGWVEFDPTNNLIVADRHIRVSIGNDYADASPSRGVFVGTADTELEVRVEVSRLDGLPLSDAELSPQIAVAYHSAQQIHQQQQQQQQQQQ